MSLRSWHALVSRCLCEIEELKRCWRCLGDIAFHYRGASGMFGCLDNIAPTRSRMLLGNLIGGLLVGIIPLYVWYERGSSQHQMVYLFGRRHSF